MGLLQQIVLLGVLMWPITGILSQNIQASGPIVSQTGTTSQIWCNDTSNIATIYEWRDVTDGIKIFDGSFKSNLGKYRNFYLGETNSSSSSLIVIHGTEIEDEGEYQCEDKDSGTRGSSIHVSVEVEGTDPVIIQTPEECTKGEECTIGCYVTGDRPAVHIDITISPKTVELECGESLQNIEDNHILSNSNRSCRFNVTADMKESDNLQVTCSTTGHAVIRLNKIEHHNIKLKGKGRPGIKPESVLTCTEGQNCTATCQITDQSKDIKFVWKIGGIQTNCGKLSSVSNGVDSNLWDTTSTCKFISGREVNGKTLECIITDDRVKLNDPSNSLLLDVLYPPSNMIISFSGNEICCELREKGNPQPIIKLNREWISALSLVPLKTSDRSHCWTFKPSSYSSGVKFTCVVEENKTLSATASSEGTNIMWLILCSCVPAGIVLLPALGVTAAIYCKLETASITDYAGIWLSYFSSGMHLSVVLTALYAGIDNNYWLIGGALVSGILLLAVCIIFFRDNVGFYFKGTLNAHFKKMVNRCPWLTLFHPAPTAIAGIVWCVYVLKNKEDIEKGEADETIGMNPKVVPLQTGLPGTANEEASPTLIGKQTPHSESV